MEINDRYMDMLKDEYKLSYLLYKENNFRLQNWSSHQLVLIHILNTITEGNVLEFGMGEHSTHIMHLICGMQNRKLYSVECDKEWASKYTHYEYVNHQITFYDGSDLMNKDNDFFHRKYAIAFIDGHPGELRQPFIEAINADYFIVHDTERILSGKKPDSYNYDVSLFKHVIHCQLTIPMTSIFSNLDVINKDILILNE